MKAANPIKFSSTRLDFFTTLNQRVNEYFKANKITRYANGEMVFKTIFMFALYLAPYFLMLAGVVSNVWAMFALSLVMGIGMAGIGLSIMHDANHGSYSNKSWVNDLLGFSLNVVGGNAFNWKVQHNVLHHTYTNIHDVDEDISPRWCAADDTLRSMEINSSLSARLRVVSLLLDDIGLGLRERFQSYWKI